MTKLPTWEEEQWIASIRGEDLKSLDVFLDGGFDINTKINCIIFNTGRRTVTGLHIAVVYKNWKSFIYLLEKNAKVNIKDNWKQTPLMYAAKVNHDLITQELIDHDADVDLQDIEMGGLLWQLPLFIVGLILIRETKKEKTSMMLHHHQQRIS